MLQSAGMLATNLTRDAFGVFLYYWFVGLLVDWLLLCLPGYRRCAFGSYTNNYLYKEAGRMAKCSYATNTNTRWLMKNMPRFAV